jgi:hypothetical protein
VDNKAAALCQRLIMGTLPGRKCVLDGDKEALMKGVDVSIAETELSNNREGSLLSMEN